jgi:hypothetical protein
MGIYAFYNNLIKSIFQWCTSPKTAFWLSSALASHPRFMYALQICLATLPLFFFALIVVQMYDFFVKSCTLHSVYNAFPGFCLALHPPYA